MFSSYQSIGTWHGGEPLPVIVVHQGARDPVIGEIKASVAKWPVTLERLCRCKTIPKGEQAHHTSLLCFTAYCGVFTAVGTPVPFSFFHRVCVRRPDFQLVLNINTCEIFWAMCEYVPVIPGACGRLPPVPAAWNRQMIQTIWRRWLCHRKR